MDRKYVVDMLSQMTNKVTAEMIVERLTDEGLLHLGHGKADVDIIVQKFSDTYGTTKVSKTDRFSANRLANKYGSQSICGIIDMLANSQTEKYAPVVNSVTQLEEKLPSILYFLRSMTGSEELDL